MAKQREREVNDKWYDIGQATVTQAEVTGTRLWFNPMELQGNELVHLIFTFCVCNTAMAADISASSRDVRVPPTAAAASRRLNKEARSHCGRD